MKGGIDAVCYQAPGLFALLPRPGEGNVWVGAQAEHAFLAVQGEP